MGRDQHEDRATISAPASHNNFLLRYEDLIADQHGCLSRIFAHCELPVPETKLRELIAAREFRKAAGRSPGEENVRSHHRKGIAGDWRTHFTDRVKDAFKQRYGQLLIDTGYETTTAW